MDKIKRNERIGAMARILTASPNHIFTLSHFCGMFDAAKSTISEDIELLRQVYRQFGLGQIETVTGAAGGVKFLPTMVPDKALEYVENLCSRLSDPAACCRAISCTFRTFFPSRTRWRCWAPSWPRPIMRRIRTLC